MKIHEIILEAEASDDELEKRYGKFDPHLLLHYGQHTRLFKAY